jgi:hypothetical protein
MFNIKKIIQEELEWISDSFYFNEEMVKKMLSNCEDVPYALFNLSTDEPYWKRGKPATAFLSMCDYWWDNYSHNEWLDDDSEKETHVVNIMPYHDVKDVRDKNGRLDTSLITYRIKDVAWFLNGSSPDEFWFLIDENGKPKYDLIPKHLHDKIKRSYEPTLTESEDKKDAFDWIRGVQPTVTGSYFTPEDVCFNEPINNMGKWRNDKYCQVNIQKDKIVFKVDYQEWVGLVDITEEDESYLMDILRHGPTYEGEGYGTELDSEEFNYIDHLITDEQKDSLQELFNKISSEEVDAMGYINGNQIGNLFKYLSYPPLIELWNTLQENVLSSLEYSIERNRWIDLARWFGQIQERTNTTFELWDGALTIITPIEKLYQSDYDLTKTLERASTPITEVYWYDAFYESWDTSGSEEDVEYEFNTFLNEAKDLLDDENFEKYKQFQEMTKELGFKSQTYSYYSEVRGPAIIFTKENPDGTFWFFHIHGRHGVDRLFGYGYPGRIELQLVEKTGHSWAYNKKVLRKYSIPIEELPDYINNYKLHESKKEDHFDWIRQTEPKEEIWDRDQIETIQVGDKLEITGEQDGIEFVNEPCRVICVGDCGPQSPTQNFSAWHRQVLVSFERSIYSNESGEETHCGPGTIMEDCNCREIGEDMVGTCWWVVIPNMEGVIRINTIN